MSSRAIFNGIGQFPLVDWAAVTSGNAAAAVYCPFGGKHDTGPMKQRRAGIAQRPVSSDDKLGLGAVKRWLPLVRAGAALLLTMIASPVGAASGCALEPIDEWPVRQVGNRLIVDGAANGQRVAIMLGTGAQQSVMLRSAAERLNLHRDWVRGFPLFGLGGESRAEAVTVTDFQVGRFAFRGWQLQVPIDQHLGDDFDVVLGEDFFSALDVEFDLAHNAVRLFTPRGGCDGVSLAYWAAEGANEVPMERVFGAHPQILLPVKIDGQPAQALLDTGATVSVLASRDARRVGLTPASPGVVAAAKLDGIGEERVDVWVGPLPSFSVGDETIVDVTMRFADIYGNVKYLLTGSRIPHGLGAEQPMLLGVDFLRAHRILVAHSQRKIYLTYVGGKVFEAHDVVPASSAWVGGSPVGFHR
jgi:predicted aspartyl protease